MSDIIQRELKRRIAQGVLAADPTQLKVARALDRLAAELKGYSPQPASGWRRLLPGNGKRKAPSGLYIHGGVGRGKSMLMDLFFKHVPIALKRRVHFHAFMQDVHRRIHAIRQQQRTGHVWDDADPIAMVAEQIASESHLLCFDEFQVADIADAMILGRLFEALFRNGIVVVATSNTAPADLYRNGLNRNVFLPFIALIEERLETIGIEDGSDYRQDRLKGERVYLTPLDEKAKQDFDRLWSKLTDGETGKPTSVPVLGREVKVPLAARDSASFSFADLCGSPLGAADYLAIAKAFHTVFIEGVPQLPRERHNEARRFITLIDTLYENGNRLVVSAEVEPENIHVEGEASGAFARTASRLQEMQSSDYWERASSTQGSPSPIRLAGAKQPVY